MHEMTLIPTTPSSLPQRSFRFFIRFCKVMGKFLVISFSVFFEAINLFTSENATEENEYKQKRDEIYDSIHGFEDPTHIHVEEDFYY